MGKGGKGTEDVDRFPLRPTSLWAGPLSYHNVVPSAQRGAKRARPWEKCYSASGGCAAAGLDVEGLTPRSRWLAPAGPGVALPLARAGLTYL